MSGQDDIYKQKYLKYKAKYLELKRYEQEGGLFDSGFGIVFTSKENATKLRDAITAGKIGGRGDIGNLLDRQAYIIFDGKKPAELLESTSRILKDKASAAMEATKSVASKAASATATAAVFAKNTVVNAFSKEQKQAVNTPDLVKSQTQQSDVPSVTGVTGVSGVTGDPNVTGVPSVPSVTGVPSVPSVPSVTGVTGVPSVLATLIGGADLPLTIATLDGKSFDRANESHKKHLANAVAVAFGLPVEQIASVSIKFKTFGKPELRE